MEKNFPNLQRKLQINTVLNETSVIMLTNWFCYIMLIINRLLMISYVSTKAIMLSNYGIEIRKYGKLGDLKILFRSKMKLNLNHE